MFGLEYYKGQSVIERETSMATVLAAAYAGAIRHARKLGADTVKVSNAEGDEIAVYPVPGAPDPHNA